MATLEEEMQTALLADSGVSALISTRLHPGKLPQKPTYPAAVYFQVSGPRGHTFTGPAYQTLRYQINCFASTYLGAATLADAFIAALPDTKATWGSFNIDSVDLQNEEYLDYEPDAKAHVKMIDFKVSLNV